MIPVMRIIHRVTLALVMVMLIVVPTASHARSLQDMFNAMGNYSNVTGANSVKGEINNYYTGGSVSARTPVVQAMLYSIQPPSVKGGCGGIDLYMGGFSYINSEQIMALLRATAANLVSELFFLALDTFVPVVSAVIKKLQAMSQMALNMSANSCALAQNLLGATSAQSLASSAKSSFSEFFELESGSSADGYAAQQESKDDETANENQAAGLANPATKDRVGQGNYVWRAIYNANYNDPSTADSQRYKELLMSMVGTVIVPTDGGPMQILAPLTITLKDMIGNNGANTANVEVYQCDPGADGAEMGCQHPNTATINTSLGSSFRQLAYERLSQIAANMRGGTPPSTADLDYLGKSSIPLYKLMALGSADPALTSTMIETAAEVIAVDYAYHYIREAYRNLEVNIAARRGSVDATQGKALDDVLAKKKELITQLEGERVATYAKVQQASKTAELLLSYDRVFAKKSSEVINGGGVRFANH